MTLNMLQASRLNPKISAYTYIFGNYYFNTTPIAPPGTKVVFHYKPCQRLTWYLNAEAGWYVGPSMKHYWCVQCYLPIKKQLRECDTVTFIPHEYPFPEVKLDDFLKRAANDIITLLSAPPSTEAISLDAGYPTRNALLNIVYTIKRLEPLPPQVPLAYTVSLTRVKEVLTVTPLMRVEG